MATSYTYRFIDSNNNIIYVGKTVNMDRRMSEHFGGKGHLPKECYSSTCRIEYKKWKTESDALIMETYYITKHNPKYNKMQKSRDVPSIVLDDSQEWKLYRQMKEVKVSKVVNTGYWRWVAVGYLIAMLIYYFLKVV